MKKWLMLLAAVLTVVLMTGALAETAEQAKPAGTVTQTGDGTDYSAYHTGYAKRALGLTSAYTSRDGLAQLSGYDRAVYLKLEALMEAVAAGTQSDTQLEITYADLGITADDVWYFSDYGFDWDTMSEDEQDAAVYSILGRDDLVEVMWLVAYDHPYDCYWFGDRLSYAWYGVPYSTTEEDPEKGVGFCIPSGYLDWPLWICAYVPSTTYADSSAEADAFFKVVLKTDTTMTSRATTAAANAREILTAAQGKSDMAKLEYFDARIHALSDYNYDAASGQSPQKEGDPWQIIYVFDNDPDTKVVCEGYSKAFQYLVQHSTFTDPELECYCASGYVTFPSGNGGAHMWNIVVKSDGNYLVDVTNDENGLDLFMAVSTEENPDVTVNGGGSTYYGKYTVAGCVYSYSSTMQLIPLSVKMYCRHADWEPDVEDVITPASCVEEGSANGVCSHCTKALGVVVLEKTGHSEELDDVPEVPATCTTAGTAAGKRCQVCGEIVEGGEEIPALGHNIVNDDYVAPTCTGTGLTAGSHCSRCDDATVAQETIAALGHDIQIGTSMRPTVSSSGYIEDVRCKRCGTYFVEGRRNFTALPNGNTLKLPASLTKIEANALAGVQATICEIPASVVSIGSKAFSGSKVLSIRFSSEECEIAEDAFEGIDENTWFLAPKGSKIYEWLCVRGYSVFVK